MGGIAFSSMRVGKKYRLINYGEKSEFMLKEVVGRNDYLLKDLFSMEDYLMSELIQYGQGEDFELKEIYSENI
ncbi:hypothetical protein [Ekhidna sp.]|uniref:hypothetical protein n=1 Tax=Ekhidna sp. TaxID=2608089 RepID=UPI0035186CE0